MVTNYRGIAALWLAFSLFGLAVPGFAETVRFGALNLAVEWPWQRANGQDENALDSIILRIPQGHERVEVDFPLRRIHLNTSPQRFFDQLDLGWKSRYGASAELNWQDISGTRWRVCRRQGMDSDSVLFQLVTVRDNEAYQVIVIAPIGAWSLPDAVLSLLQSSTWVMPLPESVVFSKSKLAAEATIVSPIKLSVTETPAPGQSWRLLKQIVVHPGKGQWEQIAKAESAHLGTQTLVTGLGLQVEQNSLDWFLDGVPTSGGTGSATQPAYQIHWRLNWSPLHDVWREGENQVMTLTFNDALETVQNGNSFGVRYEWFGVCAPSPEMAAWSSALESGQQDAMNRIETLTSGCRPQLEQPSPVTVMAGADSGSSMPRPPIVLEATLPLSKTWSESIQTRDTGSVRRFILVMHFMTSTSGKAPGDALLNQSAVIFVFGPDT
jgi:hypothetical protein